jgi:hypothetical protein
MTRGMWWVMPRAKKGRWSNISSNRLEEELSALEGAENHD